MNSINPTKNTLSRRSVIAGSGAALCCGILARPALAAPESRSLHLVNPNTRETFNAVYWSDGAPRQTALEELRHFLRDWRRDEATEIDLRVIDIVARIQRELGSDDPLKVISAYRSPETNARLRRRSKGVAKNSYHCLGMAIDISHPTVGAAQLRKIARRVRGGGVGYYPRSNFVHVDCGPLREWRG